MLKRIWEIDAARGAAVVMMVVFHALFDLSFFAHIRIAIDSGFWLIFARATLTVFLLLVGLSLSLSYHRICNKMDSRQLTVKYLKRGAFVFACGMFITLLTWLAFPQYVVLFGVLHLIGLSIIIARPLLSRVWPNLLLGLAVIAAGLWLNIQPPLYTFDFTPLLPWFGVVLLGLFAANAVRLYQRTPTEAKNPLSRLLAFLGRHALLVYFLHQPVLLAVILLV